MSNVYSRSSDVSKMSEYEYEDYVVERMRVMLKMEKDAEKWFKKKDTPFQRLILETAHHHVDKCEKEYGISRHDIRLR